MVSGSKDSKCQIVLTALWSDLHAIETGLCVEDGLNSFSSAAYIARTEPARIQSLVAQFAREGPGALLDLQFGEFGPEYAGGAASIRLHVQPLGHIHITAHLESEYRQFGVKTIADYAVMHLSTEPALLQRFAMELGSFDGTPRRCCVLECLPREPPSAPVNAA